MRELHVVALSEDGRSVLLATSRDATRGGFRVAVDERLTAAIRGDLPRPGEQQARDSTLTPKEIQARLRAGASPAEIAREAGVAVARVERFSGPVLSERAGVVAAARAAHLVRGRRGRSLLPLGEAVTAALEASSGYREDSEDWTTRREEDGRWTVTVSWFARARTRTASWTWDAGAKELGAVDSVAAALGHVEEQPGPARRAAARATHRTAAAPATAKKNPAPTKRSKPPRQKPAAATTTPAQPAAATTAPAQPTAARSTKPAAARDTKPAAHKAAAAKPAPAPNPKPGARKTTQTPGPRQKALVTTTPARTPDTPSRGARTRASVPGWADVLLGTDPRPARRAGR